MEPSFATVCGSPKIDCWPYYRYTTNRLILGRDINFPAHLMFPLAAIRLTDVEDYVARCTGGIRKAHDFASNTLKTSLRRMKRDTRKTYDEGGLVCLLCAAGVKRQMYKTPPHFIKSCLWLLLCILLACRGISGTFICNSLREP